MKKKTWISAIILIIILEGVGFLSGYLSGDIAAEYVQLIKPPFAPPGWLFAVVWPVLYALMGIAVSIIYRDDGEESNTALFWFFVQLLFNFSWSIIFFRFGAYWIALIILVILDILVAYTIYLFYKINKTAGLLLVPYLIWILFATYLNLGFALLN